MKKANPLVIPRNHFVEESIDAFTENNDLTKIYKLLNVIKNQDIKKSEISSYQDFSTSKDKDYKTFCGT